MKQFEYKSEKIQCEWDSEKHLNELGNEGWELVSITEKSGYVTCYFKREIIEDKASKLSKEFIDNRITYAENNECPSCNGKLRFINEYYDTKANVMRRLLECVECNLVWRGKVK